VSSASDRSGVLFDVDGLPEPELREAGAVEVWRDPAQLKERFADSALGKL
jgi:hypothetical protein